MCFAVRWLCIGTTEEIQRILAHWSEKTGNDREEKFMKRGKDAASWDQPKLYLKDKGLHPKTDMIKKHIFHQWNSQKDKNN